MRVTTLILVLVCVPPTAGDGQTESGLIESFSVRRSTASTRSRQESQRPTLVQNEPTCPSCRIVMTRAASVGLPDTGLVEWPTSIATDRAGRYYVTQPNKYEVPIVFGSDGRFIARLGRPGSGPGEFRTAAYVAVDRTDTIFVSDWGNHRLSVLSPRFQFIRSVPFPSGTRALAVLNDGTVLVNASISDRQTVGLPFHLFRRDGHRFKAIGDEARAYLPSAKLLLVHRIALSRAIGFWSVPLFGEYLVEHWSLDGRRDRYLQRKPAWHVTLPRELARTNLDQIDPPPTPLIGVWEDSQGFIWIISTIADPRRNDARTQKIRTPEGEVSTPLEPDRSWDTFVEVIDPERRALVATKRLDELIHLVVSPAKVAHIHERPDGLLVADILELRLEKR